MWVSRRGVPLLSLPFEDAHAARKFGFPHGAAKYSLAAIVLFQAQSCSLKRATR